MSRAKKAGHHMLLTVLLSPLFEIHGRRRAICAPKIMRSAPDSPSPANACPKNCQCCAKVLSPIEWIQTLVNSTTSLQLSINEACSQRTVQARQTMLCMNLMQNAERVHTQDWALAI